MSYVQGLSRDQGSPFPVSLDELIGPEHVCRVIAAFVNRLDLEALGFARARTKAPGRPPYDPADLLMLYLYGYLNRVRSSRRLERECQRNIELMWLLHRLTPDHKTIAEFRRCNASPLRQAGAEFVRFCAEAGLIRGEWVAVDGTKFQAVASGKAILDAAQRAELQAKLERRITQYLQELETADQQQGEAEVDAQALRQALARLQQQQSDLAQAHGEQRMHVSTEPEAVVLKGKGPGYNVQTAVDAEHALIVAHQINAQADSKRPSKPQRRSTHHAVDQIGAHKQKRPDELGRFAIGGRRSRFDTDCAGRFLLNRRLSGADFILRTGRVKPCRPAAPSRGGGRRPAWQPARGGCAAQNPAGSDRAR